MISKKFITSSFVYSVIGALPLATGFVLLPFYTGYLSTSDFGMLGIYIIFSQLIQILFNFGLDNFIPLSYIDNKDNPTKQRESLSTATVSLIILGIFLITTLYFFGNPIFGAINDMLYHNKGLIFFPWGFMSIVTAFFNSMFKSYTNLLIYQQRPLKYFWMNIFNFAITIGISLTGIYLYPYELIGPMWGRLLSGVGIFVVSFTFFIFEFGISFNKILLRPIFKFCYPLVLYAIIIWIVGNIDHFIIPHYLDFRSVGIFDFAIKCTLIIDFFQNGLTSAIQPKIYNIWKDQNLRESTPEVNRYYNGYTAITLIVLPLFLIVIPTLVPFVVTKPDYDKSFVFLAILSVGFASRGLFTMYISPISYFKKTHLLPGIFIISAILQITLNLILIKHFGLMGAVWTCFIVKIAQVILLYFATRKIFKFKYNRFKQIYLPLTYTVILIMLEYIVPVNLRIYSYIGQFVIIATLISFLYRKELKMLLAQKFW